MKAEVNIMPVNDIQEIVKKIIALCTHDTSNYCELAADLDSDLSRTNALTLDILSDAMWGDYLSLPDFCQDKDRDEARKLLNIVRNQARLRFLISDGVVVLKNDVVELDDWYKS